MNKTIKRVHSMGLGTYSDWFARLPASKVVQREDVLLYQTPTRPDSTADHIYERLGFTPATYQLTCMRRRE